MNKYIFIGLVFFGTTLQSLKMFAQTPQQPYLPTQSNPISKNYFFTTLCNQDSIVSKILREDSVVRHWNLFRLSAMKNAAISCNNDAICMIKKLLISEEEISSIGARLMQLKNRTQFTNLINRHLIPSGAYNQLVINDKNQDSLIYKAWQQDAKGMNFTLSVYAAGKRPNYPLIDSNSLQISTVGTYPRSYLSQVNHILGYLSDVATYDSSFLSLPITAVNLFLQMNERTQSADYEPMHLGVNEGAFKKIKTLKWTNYPYSVILVPGAGPSDPNTALSAEAMIRLRIASVQYHLKKAPFIIVSGGNVHPYKTRFNEAIEMKKYCVEQLGIPSSAVIVDPHARHTTTNMRNASRIMIRYGMPIEKPGLVCSTQGQSMMIANTLPSRCIIELGYVPYKNGKRLSNTLAEFYALSSSLQIDADEPIDP
jgi:hypothetical protein